MFVIGRCSLLHPGAQDVFWFIINFCEIAVVHTTDCIVQRSKAKTLKLQISTATASPCTEKQLHLCFLNRRDVRQIDCAKYAQHMKGTCMYSYDPCTRRCISP